MLLRLNHPSQQQLSDCHPPTHKTDSQKLPLACAQESFPPWRCNVVILKLPKPNPPVLLSSKSLHSCKPKILQAPNTRFLQSTHQFSILLLQLQIPKSSCNPRICFSSSATTWIHRKQTQTHCIKVSSGRRSELHLYSHVFFLGWKSLPRKSRFWGPIINSLSSFSFFSDWWFLFSGVRLSNDFCLGFQTWSSNSSWSRPTLKILMPCFPSFFLHAKCDLASSPELFCKENCNQSLELLLLLSTSAVLWNERFSRVFPQIVIT